MSTCMEAIRLVSSSITSLLFKIGSLTEFVAYQLSWLANQRHPFISASLTMRLQLQNFIWMLDILTQVFINLHLEVFK